MLKRIYKEVSKQCGISPSEVGRIYSAYWKGIRQHLAGLPLHKGITEEEFNKLNTSVNIFGIGKLYTTYDYIKRVEKYIKINEDKKHKKDKASVQ